LCTRVPVLASPLPDALGAVKDFDRKLALVLEVDGDVPRGGGRRVGDICNSPGPTEPFARTTLLADSVGNKRRGRN